MQGYKKKLVPFNLIKINILSLIVTAAAAAVTLPLNLLVFKPAKTAIFSLTKSALLNGLIGFIIILAAFIIAIVLHELLHAAGFLCTKGVTGKNVKFGVNLKKGLAYCSVNQPLSRNQYTFAGLLPACITILSLAVCTILTDFCWVILLCAMMGGCAGDFAMFFTILKFPKKQLFLDHPNLPAYYLLYPEDNLPEGFTETSEEEETALLNAFTAPKKEEGGKKKNHLVLFLIALFLFAVIIGLILALA